jgi:SAM-dependent methyltransferase
MNTPALPKCRACGADLQDSFVDLGLSPISNEFVLPEAARRGEMFYPLHAHVCRSCFLVQLEDYERAEHLFHDQYAYFSSYSSSWLAHARAYVEQVSARFGLGESSRVMEVASNDGYLLQYFVARGVPCLGIEPTANTAAAAIAKGVPTRMQFFGRDSAAQLVAEGWSADLLLGNNVLAHVPDLNDFVAGLKIALKPTGVITLEFPHLLNLMRENQFDTIYHEHFSYLSLLALEPLFARHDLAVFDVEALPTHGGSLRLYAQHAGGPHREGAGLAATRVEEAAFGLADLASYSRFAAQVAATKRALLRFLIDAREAGKRVAGYGAPAKGNTLLNYCGVRGDLLEFTVDMSPRKQGTLLPGTRIPVLAPAALKEKRPDIVLILPWNLKDEIVAEHGYIAEWGGRFAVPIPVPALIT